MNKGRHYAAALTAFIIWGFISIPLRALRAYPAGEILYFRILFSFSLLIIFIIIFKRRALKQDWHIFKSFSSERKKNVSLLVLAGGILLTFNWLTFIYTVNNINIKTASFSYLICPVITAVLGYVLLKEKISMLQWVAVGLCAFSCILIGINSVTELGFSFLTAITYALYLISQRKNQGFDRIVGLGIQVLCAFVILSLLYGYLVSQVPVATRFYSIIFVIAVLFTIIPLFLNLYTLNEINSATIGILMYINPLVNFIVAFVMFKETITYLQFVSYMIIAVALVIFNYANMKKLQRLRTNKVL